MQTFFLVVIYGKRDLSSETFLSLLRSRDDFSRATLVVFNNGPAAIDFAGSDFTRRLELKFAFVIFREDVDNRPLSLIYNQLMREFPFDRIIILDDDTSVDEQFLSNLDQDYTNRPNVDLQLPRIISRDTGELCYPRINAVPHGAIGRIGGNCDVYSIGSGLVIYRSLFDKFINSGMSLFDENFAFYGVDYSLFYRMKALRKMGIPFSIDVVSELRHSMSGALPLRESWRAQERIYDRLLTLKYYEDRPLRKFGRVMLLGLCCLKEGRGLLFLRGCSIYRRGRHPRCDKYADLNC